MVAVLPAHGGSQRRTVAWRANGARDQSLVLCWRVGGSDGDLKLRTASSDLLFVGDRGGWSLIAPGMQTVLIVDDDPAFRQVMRRILERHQFTVAEAEEPAAALRVAREWPPDLVLCDITLPHGSGFDVLAELNREPRTRNVPVVIITGLEDPACQRRGMDAGADDFLRKPFSEAELLAAVRVRLRKREAVRQERQRMERRLVGLLETTIDLVALVEPENHRISYLNPWGSKVLEVENPAESAQLRWADFYPEGQRSASLTQGLPEATIHGVWTGEDVLQGRRGRQTPVCQHLYAHPADNGEIEFFSLVARDVTRTKKDQRRLRDSQELYQSLVDHLPHNVFRKAADGQYTFANERFCDTLGRPLPDIVGRTDADLFPAGLAQAHRDSDLLVMGSARSLTRMEEHVLPSGRRIQVEVIKSPLRDAEGRVVGVQGMFYDITERARAEQALRESGEVLQAITGSVLDAIVMMDPGGFITYWNQAAERLFGYSRAEAVGQPLHALLAPARFATDSGRGIGTFSQRGVGPLIGKTIELPARRKDGQEFVLEVALSVVRLHTQWHAVGVARDITERKRVEAQRASLNIQLQQAQKLESIGQLAAGIAHEINTPTQYIGDNTRFVRGAFDEMSQVFAAHQRLLQAARRAGFAPELVDEVDAAAREAETTYLLQEIPRALDQSLEGVGRVARIVGAMKDFSHPDSAEKVPADLNKAVETTLTVCRNEWKYVAEVMEEFDPTLPAVPCLLGEINQVILNLVVNAAHAIAAKLGEGSPVKGTIRVRTRQDGAWAEVEVADTGTGIPAGLRDRVFTPFFTTKGVGKGTGQGLAFARSVVVEKHGGTIGFDSEEGVGTKFWVRLPLEPSQPTDPPPVATPAPVGASYA
jgi:two-component system, NtrC family, sensor kinase